MFDVAKAREAQEKYCKNTDAPHFAPETGRCWKCNRNIYEQYGWKVEQGRASSVPLNSPECTIKTGITVDQAKNVLVTGCPHCHRSYCD